MGFDTSKWSIAAQLRLRRWLPRWVRKLLGLGPVVLKGAKAKVFFNGVEIAEFKNIEYNVNYDKPPEWVMGKMEPFEATYEMRPVKSDENSG